MLSGIFIRKKRQKITITTNDTKLKRVVFKFSGYTRNVLKGQKNAENAKCFGREKKKNDENKIKFEEYSIHNGKLSLKNRLKRQHYSHQS